MENFPENVLGKLKKLAYIKSRTLKCSNCDFTTNNRNVLLSHVKNHGLFLANKVNETFSCALCSYVSEKQRNLAQHMIKYHRVENMSLLKSKLKIRLDNLSLVTGARSEKKIKSNSCKKNESAEICEINFNESLLLQRDSTVPQDIIKDIFSCRYCNYRSTDKNNVKSHMRRHGHQVAKPFKEIYVKRTLGRIKKFEMEKQFTSNSHSSKNSVLERPLQELEKNVDSFFCCKFCNFKCIHRNVLKKHMGHHEDVGVQKHRFGGPIFYSKAVVQKHEQIRKLVKPYQCNSCDYKTQIKSNLRRHMKVHSLEALTRKFKCDLCHYICYHWTSLKRHMENHKHIEIFKCDVCDFATYQQSDLEKHTKSHTGERPFVCPVCNFNSPTRTELNKHLKRHKAVEPYSCSFCCYVCNGIKGNDHLENHPGERPYLCETCPFRSRHKVFNVEYKKILKSDRKFICQFCGFSYTCLSALNVHIKKHTKDNLFQCEHCDYCTPRKYDLHQHQRKHTGDSYPCYICGYETNFKTNLVRHLRRHSMIDPPTPGSHNPLLRRREGKGLQKPYRCDECNFQCRYKTIYLAHKQKHSREKNFMCYQCDFSTSSIKEIKNHVISHSEQISALNFKGIREQKNSENDKSLLLNKNLGYTTLHKALLGSHEIKHRSSEISEKSKYVSHNESLESNQLAINNQQLRNRLLEVHLVNDNSVNHERDLERTKENKEINRFEFKINSGDSLPKSISNICVKRENDELHNLPQDCSELIESEEVIIYQEESNEHIEEIREVESNQSGSILMFICGICEFSSSSQSELEKHLESHDHLEYTLNMNNEDVSLYKDILCKEEKFEEAWGVVKEEPTMFECDVCGFRSKYKANVKAHAKLHGSERPFACDLCSYKTVYKSAFNVHKRKHTKEGLKQCQHCNYSTVIHHDFTKHMRIHTGDKPYLCDTCGYKSRFRSNWLRHKVKHKKDLLKLANVSNKLYGLEDEEKSIFSVLSGNQN